MIEVVQVQAGVIER